VRIAELIRTLVCALPCWRCVIECYVCPLLNDLHYAEQWLYGDGTLYADVHNLHDLHYWHTRNKEVHERRFNRIKAVLAAWEKPAQTIEKALNDNQALIDAACKLVGTDPGKAVYDVFLKLVPRCTSPSRRRAARRGRRASGRSTRSSAGATPARPTTAAARTWANRASGSA
jgi:hypothetical protein